jgi:hypothetical protein
MRKSLIVILLPLLGIVCGAQTPQQQQKHLISASDVSRWPTERLVS